MHIGNYTSNYTLTILVVTITNKLCQRARAYLTPVLKSCMPYTVRRLYCEVAGWVMPNCNWSVVQWLSQNLPMPLATPCSSSWWGFTTASDRQRLESFLRRRCRQNLYSTDKPFITQIVEEADENLFIRYDTIRYDRRD